MPTYGNSTYLESIGGIFLKSVKSSFSLEPSLGNLQPPLKRSILKWISWLKFSNFGVNNGVYSERGNQGLSDGTNVAP